MYYDTIDAEIKCRPVDDNTYLVMVPLDSSHVTCLIGMPFCLAMVAKGKATPWSLAAEIDHNMTFKQEFLTFSSKILTY